MKKYFLTLVMLLSVQVSFAVQWKGQWASTFGKINLLEKTIGFKDSTLVFGNYAKSGFIIGVTVDKQLHGLFYDSKLNKSGAFKFTLNKSGSNFKGTWRFDDIDKELKWNGTKAVEQSKVKLNGIDRNRTIEGMWNTNFGELSLTQEGPFVEGKYDTKGKLYAVYNQENNIMFGLFTNKNRYGLLKFQLNDDRSAYQGQWSWETSQWSKQKWDGTKQMVKVFR